tara:strand:- start:1242 stop:1556 length:315 start_codon:yes stop_codon:yes gene_type:complete
MDNNSKLDEQLVNSSIENMSNAQRIQFDKLSKEMFGNVDFKNAKILNQLKPPMEDRLAYITDGLRSGIHPTHLEKDEIITLEEAYGKEWYKKWNFTEEDLTSIN